ncbi:DNA double-strand break repair nuclease NurA [Zophobihabitans entericus]|uniref:DNA double-strand break repair nuclease NurA n=1 Tax=Zophobihabitans entericus TaxID=1635327 RepID=A0A6G9ID78_9GAMM|nr:DNA double-strand break repair nuclease NurA [Zophobihabitans entericus]QIQ22185.1 DNA double-strand break repair nuclease NurA [Zophobihabitans entericus]
MGTTSRGNKPNEWAAKINHTHIINDPFIKNFISNCFLPKDVDEIDIKSEQIFEKLLPTNNPIQHFLAVDGGYTIVEPKKQFPSAQFAFFQFGAILFGVDDVERLSEKPFIFPEDMKKLHNLQRFKLALPIKNILSHNQESLKNSIRKTLYDFFMISRDHSTFMETLKWFIFQEYSDSPKDTYSLSNDPNLDISTGTGSFELKKEKMNADYTFDSPNGKVYLTDVFRLHEAVDEEHGAGGILGYLTRLIEQLIIVHFIKYIYAYQATLLNSFLFITDGPLSFSGQTANMHKPMRNLCNFLKEKHNLFLVGLEKSGPFVEHAQQISLNPKGDPILKNGEYFLLSNNYTYKYITPGDPTKMHYGSTSYYGGKIIFHSDDNQIFVLTVPTTDKDSNLVPHKKNYKNLEVILLNIQKLKCHMYDDSIIPIALANKLVSLANHPSKVLLDKFVAASLKSD